MEAKFSDATAAAEALGVNQTTYLHHENGRRGFKGAAADYARRFHVNLEWLLTGRGPMRGKAQGRTLDVSGTVGAGAQVHLSDGPTSPFDHIEVPFDIGSDATAVEVRGDSMWPAIQEGEVLIYERIRHDPIPLVGRKVVACLADGRMFVKLLGKRNKDGLWTLLSFNGPPMEDVELLWAAEIRAILRR